MKKGVYTLDGRLFSPERVENVPALASRYPDLVMPDDNAWPAYINDPKINARAARDLPVLIKNLSSPIEPISPEQLMAMFAQNPLGRRSVWQGEIDDEGGVFTSRGYTIGFFGHRHIPGLRLTFDYNGRLAQSDEYWFTDTLMALPPASSKTYAYDAAGYCVQATDSYGYPGYAALPMTDTFVYADDESGGRTPIRMERSYSQMVGFDPVLLIATLENHQEWLENALSDEEI